MSQKLRWRRPPPAKPGEVNYSFVDRFTFAHMGIGIVYALIDLEFYLVVILAIAWEVIEDPMKAHMSFLFPHATSDTWKNIFGDMLAVVVGWLILTLHVSL